MRGSEMSYRTGLLLFCVCTLMSAPLSAEETKKGGFFGSFLQAELNYVLDFVTADKEFKAVGDWNRTGTDFEVATKAATGIFGLGLGVRYFPLRVENGLYTPLRVGFSTAQLSIDWVDAAGKSVESSDFAVTLGGGVGYRQEIGTDLIDEGLGLFIMPEVGVEFLTFSSSPNSDTEPAPAEGESTDSDSFSFTAAALTFRLTAEGGATTVFDNVALNVMFGAEYHYPLGFSASRSFSTGGDDVSGDTKGSAGLFRVFAGVSL